MGRGVSNLFGLVGALVGGGVGFVLFRWIAGQGFYAPFVVGGVAGLGCLLLARHVSIGRGVAVGILAVVMEVLAEWAVFPFARDNSLGFFLRNVPALPPIKLVLIGVGGLIAGWLGRDSLRAGRKPAASRSDVA